MQFKGLGKIIALTQTLPLSINAVRQATEGLTGSTLLLGLSLTNLNEEGLKTILVCKGLEGAELKNALAAIKDAQGHGILGAAFTMLRAKIISLMLTGNSYIA